MAPERATAIPRSALVLGWLGVSPFVGLATAVAFDWPVAADTTRSSLAVYGAVILSFLGGAQWGLTLTLAGGPVDLSRCLAISVLPAIAAWASLALLSMPAATLALAAAFALLLAYDLAIVRRGLAPAWYAALRAPLTAVAIACFLVPTAALAA